MPGTNAGATREAALSSGFRGTLTSPCEQQATVTAAGFAAVDVVHDLLLFEARVMYYQRFILCCIWTLHFPCNTSQSCFLTLRQKQQDTCLRSVLLKGQSILCLQQRMLHALGMVLPTVIKVQCFLWFLLL